MRRVIVFVNRVAEIGFRQTTALLIAAFVRNGCRVSLADIHGLSIRSSGSSLAIDVCGVEVPMSCETSDMIEQLAQQHIRFELTSISSDDLIVIRTNPGRDVNRQSLHQSFLNLTEIVESLGVQVVNSPARLSFFASKSSLAIVDARYRPAMLVTNQPDAICEFVGDARTDCVVKPLVGSRGANVMRVNAAMEGLAERLATTFASSMMIAQHFVDAPHQGDRRVVVLDGEILERDGRIAGIERRPAADDFRANLHAGGTAHPFTLTGNERSAASHAAKLLADNGIRLAGVDLIGDQVIELNVFSTGGIFDANRFARNEGLANFDFTETIAERLLTQL